MPRMNFTLRWTRLLVLAVSCTISIQAHKINSPKSKTLNVAINLDMRGATDTSLYVQVARAIRKIAGYFLKEASNMLNALDDVLFCIDMAKGQLVQLRQEEEACRGRVLERLVKKTNVCGGGEAERLLEEAEADLSVAEQIMKANFKYSPNYLKNFSFTRIGAQGTDIRMQDPAFTIPNFEVVWNEGFERNLAIEGYVTEFSTENSDACLSQIQPRLVPAQLRSHRTTYCPVDAPCWLMTTRPGTGGYYLTHQFLFLLLGENGGCAPDFKAQVERYFGDLLPADPGLVTTEIMRHQCAAVLRDAELIAHYGNPDVTKDLFVEQGFLCGAAFFMPEFFDPEWIRDVLSWQMSSGCFGFPNPTGPGIDDYPIIEAGDSIDKTWEALRQIFEERVRGSRAEGDFSSFRTPRASGDKTPAPKREQVMSNSCFAHYTAVALGYFAVAMRYISD